MRSETRSEMRWMAAAVVACAALMGAASASAGGPRFVTGGGMWVVSGVPIAFYTPTPEYYTDPGALSANVTHAQADAMVAAAAAPWNVPTSRLVLKQGGELAEHVSSANVYFDGSEMVFPADVSATNYQNIPIAVIYDTDGSVIDTLLGAASAWGWPNPKHSFLSAGARSSGSTGLCRCPSARGFSSPSRAIPRHRRTPS